MTNFQKIRNSKYGCLFKLKKPKYLTIQNTVTMFGIEKNYNKNIIKWTLNYINKNLIEEIEFEILNMYNLENNSNFELKSKLDIRKNYKPLLVSALEKNIHDVYEHENGDLIDNKSINKNTPYNVDFIVKYFSLSKNFIQIKIEINKIRNALIK